MNIGTAIKKIRKEKGIGQREIAEKCNISVNALSQIETNATFPQKGTIQKISEVLNVPVSYILFLSISDEDIPESKREAFNYLNSAVKSILLDSLEESI